jgi:hypothetical protein
MEIARLTAICRKTDCGPLENELVRLRAHIAALEERKTGDSESEAEEEMEFASKQMRTENWHVRMQNWKSRKTRTRISTARTSISKARMTTSRSRSSSSSPNLLISRPRSSSSSPSTNKKSKKFTTYTRRSCKRTWGSAVGYSLELEEENEKLKDEMAMMAMEGHVAGFGGDLSAEEQAYQQAKQQHSS